MTILEPRFKKCEAFRVLGVEDNVGNIEEANPGFHDLWMNRFMSRHDNVQPHSTDGAYYAVWFGTCEVDPSQGTYLAGMAVTGNHPDTGGQDSPVSVWIPVRRKA